MQVRYRALSWTWGPSFFSNSRRTLCGCGFLVCYEVSSSIVSVGGAQSPSFGRSVCVEEAETFIGCQRHKTWINQLGDGNTKK